MKKLAMLVVLLWGSMIFGQNKQLLYNFNDLPQSLMSNPGGEVNFDMHLGIPFLSGISVGVGSSGVSMYDVFNTKNGSINTNIAQHLPKMSNRDFFDLHQEMEVLFLGWRDRKKHYFSAGIYQETDAIIYFPKDMAVLTYEGNKNHIGKDFDFSEAAFSAEVINVFHFGMTKYISKDLNFGVRGKLYSSVLNARSINNHGNFKTVLSPDDPNIYRHYVNMDMLIHTSGYASLIDEGNTRGEFLRKFAKRAFFGGDLGLGVDLGFTYYLNEKTKFTGSIIDLGFINHTQNVENYHYFGNYQTDGIELKFPKGSSPNYWDQWEKDLDAHLHDKTTTTSYITWRPVKLNAAVEFGFNEDRSVCDWRHPTARREYFEHLGLQFFSIKRPRGFVNAGTLSYDKKLSDVFKGKITYTVDSFSYYNIGLLFSTRISSFNFYLAADNVLAYPNLARAQHASVQLGFQFLINKK